MSILSGSLQLLYYVYMISVSLLQGGFHLIVANFLCATICGSLLRAKCILIVQLGAVRDLPGDSWQFAWHLQGGSLLVLIRRTRTRSRLSANY